MGLPRSCVRAVWAVSGDFLGTVLGSMGVFLAYLGAVAGFLDLSGSSWRLSQICLQLSLTSLQFYGHCLELSLPLWGYCGLWGGGLSETAWWLSWHVGGCLKLPGEYLWLSRCFLAVWDCRAVLACFGLSGTVPGCQELFWDCPRLSRVVCNCLPAVTGLSGGSLDLFEVCFSQSWGCLGFS